MSGFCSCCDEEDSSDGEDEMSDPYDWAPEKGEDAGLEKLTKRRQEYRVWLRQTLQVLREIDEPRDCTNVAMLPIIVILLFAACTLPVVATVFGDVRWLGREWDYHGRLCGIHPRVLNQRFVYWPRPDDLSATVCVNGCPSLEAATADATVQLPKADPLLLSETSDQLRMVLSQTVWMVRIPVYATVPALGRFCIPAPDTALPVPGLVTVNGSSTFSTVAVNNNLGPAAGPLAARDTLLAKLHGTVGTWVPQLRRSVGDLQSVQVQIICALIGSTLLGGAYIVLIFCGVSPLLWISIITFGLGAVTTGGVVLFRAMTDSVDFHIVTLNDLQVTIAPWVGLTLIAIGIFALVQGLLFRDELRWAAACVETGLLILSEEGLLCPLGLVSGAVVSAQLVAILCWLAIFPALVGIASVSWPGVAPSGGSVPPPNTMGLPDSVVPGGPAVLGLQRSPAFSIASLPLAFVSILALRFVLELNFSLGRYIVSHVLARWYFSEPSEGGDGPRRVRLTSVLCNAVYSAILAHLGSIAMSAALHTVVPSQTLRFWSVIMDKWQAPWRDSLESHGLKAHDRDTCGSRAQRLAALLGPAPYVELALQADSIEASGQRVLFSVPRALPAVQHLLSLPTLFATAVSLPVPLLLGTALVAALNIIAHDNTGYVETSLGAGVLLANLTYILFITWGLLHSECFDVLLFLLACDDGGHWRFEHPLAEKRPVSKRWVASLDSSFALWSSVYTPPRLRGLVFAASNALKTGGAPIKASHNSWEYSAISGEACDAEEYIE